jgi:hypothetical protein
VRAYVRVHVIPTGMDLLPHRRLSVRPGARVVTVRLGTIRDEVEGKSTVIRFELAEPLPRHQGRNQRPRRPGK